ncbi:MAG: prepilin-type N-terminal cleavage/methylation domain-containing protein [Magnetococcus sp. DMHC-6]
MITIKKKQGKNKKKSGFSLIETAIVVVIIGLMMGGVLKGQEMIRNARSANLADQGDAVKVAIMGFSDRYRALPGDFSKASEVFANTIATTWTVTTNTTTNKSVTVADSIGDDGDGNSRIGGNPDDSSDQAGIRAKEIALAWKHLSASGFITGDFDGNEDGIDEDTFSCKGTTCLTNAYNGGLILAYDHEQVDITDTTNSGNSSSRSKSNQLTTGRNIPVEIISEVDNKVDDGRPGTGAFRMGDTFKGTTCYADKDGDNETITGTTATSDANVYQWDVIRQATDCGAVYIF